MTCVLAAALIGMLWTPPDSGTAILRGRVVAADTGKPLARAEVLLDGAREAALFTDADGHYEFRNLPPGRYLLRAQRAGYVTMFAGQQQPTEPVREFALETGQTRGPIDFRLPRSGAIEITVFDEFGDPLPNVAIVPARGVPRAQGTPWRPGDMPGLLGGRTDANGHARLFDLAPDTYYLTAYVNAYSFRRPPLEGRDEIGGGRIEYAPTFYPGTTVVDEATSVRVEAMQTLSVQLTMTPRTVDESHAVIISAHANSEDAVPFRPVGSDPAATGRVSGRVLAADGSGPLARAIVRLTPTPEETGHHRRALTDAEGRYEFIKVAAGQYILQADARGYLSGVYGQQPHREAVHVVRVEQGQSLEHVDVVLPKPAAITVRVTDDLGNPLPWMVVKLLQFPRTGHPPRADEAREPALMGRRLADLLESATDDRGELRIADLPPDEYWLQLIPLHSYARLTSSAIKGSRPAAYAPTYYPGTTLLRDAKPIVLNAGQEVTVELMLKPTLARQVRGRALAADGTPAHGDVVLRDLMIDGSEPLARVTLDEEGRFLFSEVWPGQHVIETPLEWDQTPATYGAVTVDVLEEDVADVVLRISPPGTLRGHIVFEEGAPPEDTEPADFSLKAYVQNPLSAAAGVQPVETRPAEDWSFTLTGVLGPSLVVAWGESGWIARRITLDGTDVTHAPLYNASDLQIVVTRASTVGGTVVDHDGKSVIHCGILVFSEDAPDGRPIVHVSRTDAKGQFSLEAVAPGPYFAIALSEAIDDDMTAPASLDRLKRQATRISIPPGGDADIKVTLTLSEPEPRE
jgi:hypothetical protein